MEKSRHRDWIRSFTIEFVEYYSFDGHRSKPTRFIKFLVNLFMISGWMDMKEYLFEI